MEGFQYDWKNLENCMGFEVPISLKYILLKCGYDSIISIRQICEERIEELQNFIERNKNEILFNEKCNMLDDISAYQNQKTFKFLPGHKNILLDLPKHIQMTQSKNALESVLLQDVACDDEDEYSLILRELIKSAKRNQNKSKHAFNYNNTIKYFSTYIFLLCGRTCYETLCKNLPIPSTKTVCKNIFALVDFQNSVD